MKSVKTTQKQSEVDKVATLNLLSLNSNPMDTLTNNLSSMISIKNVRI